MASPTSKNSENPTKKKPPPPPPLHRLTHGRFDSPTWTIGPSGEGFWPVVSVDTLWSSWVEWMWGWASGEWRGWRNWLLKTDSWIRARSTPTIVICSKTLVQDSGHLYFCHCMRLLCPSSVLLHSWRILALESEHRALGPVPEWRCRSRKVQDFLCG
jgi:hypothetical protein